MILEELICELEEIERLKRQIKKLEDLLQKYEKEKNHELDESIVSLMKLQLEMLLRKLKEKEGHCEKLEAEIASLRKDLEKSID